MKATWKGTIKLGFVVQPVAVYGSAESKAAKVSFNQLHTCGNRINQKTVCVHCDAAKEVPKADISRGFEFEKGKYVVVGDDELKGCEIETTKVIDLKEFVPAENIEPFLIAETHYIAPDNPALADAFALIRDALDGFAGIGTLAIRNREQLVAIVRHKRGLMMHTLRHASEVRDIAAVDALARVPDISDAATVGMMRQLMATMRSDRLDLEKYPNTYVENVRALIDRKVSGEEPATPAAAPAPKVDSLAEMLRASLAAQQSREVA